MFLMSALFLFIAVATTFVVIAVVPGLPVTLVAMVVGLACAACYLVVHANVQRAHQQEDRERADFEAMRLRLEQSATRSRMQPEEEAALVRHVHQHRAALGRNLERSLILNDYGKVVSDRRGDVYRDFLGSIPELRYMSEREAIAVIDREIDVLRSADGRRGFDPLELPTDGHDFEFWVADALRLFGWEARVTQGSGDQGIDVIATRDGSSLGIQCKLYSGGIGNKAVQEAHAGKIFHGTDLAAVLSNAEYTRSARALAASTGIMLLSPHDIPTLHEQFARADRLEP